MGLRAGRRGARGGALDDVVDARRAGSHFDLEDEYVADAVDGDLDRADRAALARVQGAVASLRWPAQNVEFVAKRLLHGDSPDGTARSVLLGTPVYVATVD